MEEKINYDELNNEEVLQMLLEIHTKLLNKEITVKEAEKLSKPLNALVQKYYKMVKEKAKKGDTTPIPFFENKNKG
jgi:uncharacterized protein YfkK (UPF0435 family)